MTARISGGSVSDGSRRRGEEIDPVLTGLEGHQTLEAALDLGEQGLDTDNKLEHNLKVAGDEGLDVEEETLEAGHAVLEEGEIALKGDNDLEESLGVNLDRADDAG
jgi:hypothetical protein